MKEKYLHGYDIRYSKALLKHTPAVLIITVYIVLLGLRFTHFSNSKHEIEVGSLEAAAVQALWSI